MSHKSVCRYERASDFRRMSLILSTGHASGGFAVLRRGRKGIRELSSKGIEKGCRENGGSCRRGSSRKTGRVEGGNIVNVMQPRTQAKEGRGLFSSLI